MTRGLRIVRVLPFYGNRHGGPVVQARLVNRELVARGHRVVVLSSDLDQPEATPRDTWCEHDGCRTFFARAGALAGVPPFVPPRAARAALAEALGDCDVATVNVGLSRWGNLLATLGRRAGVPFVYNAEGALDPVRLRVKRWRKVAFVALCERPVLRAAAAVHAVTTAEAADVARLGGDPARVHVIPNGVVLPPEPTAEQRARGRRRLGVPAAARLVLFLGRLHALKGIDLALAAAAAQLRARPDLHFAIVGPDDGAQATVRSAAAALGCGERVRVHAAVHGEAKHDVLAAADVFALTSRSEGLPNAALEAAAAGLPLWLTEHCRLPEVAEFAAGVVAPLERGALEAALAELLADVDGERRMAANARTMVAARFAIGAVVDRLEALYRGLVR